MSLSDLCGYKAYWHPHGDYNLPYRLLYPYNYNPEQSYPLLVFTGGSGENGDDNILHISRNPTYGVDTVNGWSITAVFHAGDSGLETPIAATAAYSQWPCFVLCPQCPNTSTWEPYNGVPNAYTFEYQFHTFYWDAQVHGWFTEAVLSLVQAIQQPGFAFYNAGDTEETLESVDGSAEPCNIDANRIYHMGASLGGLACYSLAKEGRDIWAAMIPTKAFNCGTPYLDYYRPDSPDYDAEVRLRHKREYARIYHIPQLLIDYQGDNMYDTMQGMHEVQQEYLEEVYGEGSPSIATKLLFVSLPGGNHGAIGDFNSIFTTTNLMDVADSDEQQYGVTGMNPMDWLFAQTKPSCPDDPYPAEEETYYPERSYVVISNESVSDSVYTGQKIDVACDKEKELKVRVAGVDADVVFTDGIYVHSQFFTISTTLTTFRLRDRGQPGYLDKLSPRVSFIGV